MSITYKLREEVKVYGDYRDTIRVLVESNPGQMSFDEYDYVYNLIQSKKECNLFIKSNNKASKQFFRKFLWIRQNIAQVFTTV